MNNNSDRIKQYSKVSTSCACLKQGTKALEVNPHSFLYIQDPEHVYIKYLTQDWANVK